MSHAVLAPALEPLSAKASSVDKLEWTCRKFGLEQPVYKTVREALGHFCTIKVLDMLLPYVSSTYVVASLRSDFVHLGCVSDNNF